ncbi:DUF1830 domain-containing protein [Trichormus variabilis ARAD]|nr:MULTISPECIES: DUF1830 domain-containing protein [Nostocaceae]MBC1216720.1 DUF1830 domain-containing protein [Trichormus variabilis ARAD]MBC1258859.1 DUF1830 domain-containing protein [Trichormus variabilis V5]MBC1269658.1 DUF1830 domain-containing protein [Trichormus variabilis FSR]MBC1304968.1 DUF1830 domain-containing protein [Trichormus variabilis N2B]MBC1313038.1 DUF1830 domain-containing protein [Trichormus variabilis PNB]
MAQILDPLPPEQSGKVLCCYVNATSKIQVARITNVPNWYFERVVFPGQRLVFEAPIEGQMEIHTGMMASAILSDTIPCDRLIMSEPSSNEFNTDSVGTDPISTKSVVQTNNTKPLTVAGLASVE